MSARLSLPAGSLAFLLVSGAAPVLAQVKVSVSPVVAAPVRQTLQLPGTVVSPQSSALATRVEGHVEALLVEAGDRVTRGQPLLTLDATLGRLELERLQHSLREAEHVHRDSQRLAKEAETLAGVQSVSQSKYRSQVAQAAIDESKLEQLKSAVAIQRERIGRHTLTAPFDGVVTGRQTERGQWVGADTAVLRLMQTDRLRVDVDVPERLHGLIAPGQTVTLAFGDGAPVEAGVERVVPSSDPVSRTFPVHVALPNPQGTWMPGMSARVVFALAPGAADDVTQVPADAVERRPDGSVRVWVVRPASGGTGGGTVARPVAVRTGRHAGDRIEVTSPEIRAGDAVVVRGNEGLRPDQPVIPVPASDSMAPGAATSGKVG
ncbi:efflux RND transporter periplasmic adaptor subunit [Azospirillum doebereinerae]|uniref:Efflux RND transporter periplasmic adaptor subunit n=1 Tax=Azospirillum doebereinerae TaxID=92933 RepID=A0A433J5G2_9PROT|nr:efflux RND transporter periplasmic adaptor subunit [Azospirillum doebereinerae]RUQ67815.1 efflux RND transporter periplasmic adaptor subunit [Azospirillum doebereinerae]